MVRRLKITPEELPGLKERIEDVRPALKRMGAIMLATSQKAFADQAYGPERWPERYEGQPDPFISVAGALSDLKRDQKIKDRRFDRRPALVDTGILRNSLTFGVKGKRSVSVGTTDPKAPKHLFGQTSKQQVTDIARKRLVKEYHRLKRQGGSRFDAVKKLGFLHTVSTLDTQIQQRVFLGFFPDLEKELAEVVEDYIAGEGA